MEKNQITFTWRNITITSALGGSGRKCCPKKNTTVQPVKTILKNVSGYCKPGQVLAIMGASGAGKSTLLNVLNYRNLSGVNLDSGERFANGVLVTPNSLTSISAYIQQDDLFIGTLTVKEHLLFQAKVRMDRDVPYSERLERIDSVMHDLGLKKCADTLIGVQGRIKGISGGESKRLAFASEVLTNPALMFCDEPTSGLDSYMAQNVVEVLKKLAKNGKTIVCTIHQPSSQVFELFDQLLLMAEGQVAYLGSTAGAINFFENIGFPSPSNFNPADHYVQVLAVVPGKEDECRVRISAICQVMSESEHGKAITEEVVFQLVRARNTKAEGPQPKVSSYKATWWQQFKAVLWRSFKSILKEPMAMQVRIGQTVVVALILGVIYLNQKNDQVGVQNINGALFLLLANINNQYLFSVVNVFCAEVPIFLREHFNGMYRTDIYFICKQLAELPSLIFTPLLFVIIFYYMVGMNPAFERFIICCIIILLITQVGVGFGYFISCLAPNPNAALGMSTPILMPLLLFGGTFLNDESVPKWLSWMKYISWFKYGNEALVVNQWNGLNITETVNKTSRFKTGDDVINYLNYDKSHVLQDIAILGLFAIVVRILAFLALLAKTYRKRS